MIKETYHNQVESLKQLEPEALFHFVARFKPRGMTNQVFEGLYDRWEKNLAPSRELHKEFNLAKEQNKTELKLCDIDAHNTAFTKIKYKCKFHKEMNNPDSIKGLERVKKMAESRDIFLVCYESEGYECHRYLLIEMIERM